MEVYPGITMDSEVRFGKPCIKGTRIDVATVLGRFAAGDKIEDIQEDYRLTRDQVMSALACSRASTSRRQIRMIVLLDENFPLRFYTRLQKEGLAAQHILLTDRGIHDKEIIQLLVPIRAHRAIGIHRHQRN